MVGSTDSAVRDSFHAPGAESAPEGANIDTVLAIREAATAYAAHQAQPTADCEPIYAWNRAIERLTPAVLVELCDVWLLVEAENETDRAAYHTGENDTHD